MPLRLSERGRIVLLIGDRADADGFERHLEQIEPMPEIRTAIGRDDFLLLLDKCDFDVILCSTGGAGIDAGETLEIARLKAPDVPFIVVSADADEVAATESLRLGAFDHLAGQGLARLPYVVARALAATRRSVEFRRMEEQKEMLVRELSHRVKNTMAMVMSLVRRTTKNSETVDDYAQNLLGRLRAMTEAHGLLFATNWSRAELADVVTRALAAYAEDAGERFLIAPGTSVLVPPKTALALSMVLNELTANAVKFGALSLDSGRVEIAWDRFADVVTLIWRELGGPAAAPPANTGFGTVLIERSIRYELRGEVVMDYAPGGLVCMIRFPA